MGTVPHAAVCQCTVGPRACTLTCSGPHSSPGPCAPTHHAGSLPARAAASCLSASWGGSGCRSTAEPGRLPRRCAPPLPAGMVGLLLYISHRRLPAKACCHCLQADEGWSAAGKGALRDRVGQAGNALRTHTRACHTEVGLHADLGVQKAFSGAAAVFVHGSALWRMKDRTCSTLLADTSMSVLTTMRQAKTCTLCLATLAGTKTCRQGLAGVGD